MPTYNSEIDRSGAQALMPEDVSLEIIQSVPETSAVMRLARRLPNMSRKQRRVPVLDALITAGWVSGDTGLKQTSEVSWANKYITAEELAVIVPIPEAVLDDADYDIWGEIRPRIVEAFGRAFDQAVLYGTNAPDDFPDDLLTQATAASHVIDYSTQVAAGEDVYDIIMGASGLIALVEADGFMPNGHIAAMVMRGRLRGLREQVYDGSSTIAGGAPIFQASMTQAGQYLLDGEPIEFPRNGSMDAATALMFTGDWNQLVYAMRQDVSYKILDQAVIQDGAGNIIFNLAQQDMVALRAVMRLGWQLPNPVAAMNTDAATRLPFSVLVP